MPKKYPERGGPGQRLEAEFPELSPRELAALAKDKGDDEKSIALKVEQAEWAAEKKKKKG